MSTEMTFHQYDEARRDYLLGQLILYVCEKSREDATFGATKLNKTLYFSDFISYGLTRQALTGSAYMKIKHGPVPLHLVPVRDRLIEAGKLELRVSSYPARPQHRIIPLASMDEGVFTSVQLAVVDAIRDVLANETAAEVSERSHGQAYDDAGEFGNLIPYESIFLDADQTVTYDDVLAARDLMADRAEFVK